MRESETVEFKSQYVEDIKKEIIAFANTNGGTLYIGVNDDGQAIGVDNTDEIMLRTANAIRDAIKPDVMMFVQIHTESIQEKSVVCVEVQRGTARPYYLAGKGIRPEGVYVRQGSASVPASTAAILRMIKETDGDKYECLRSVNQDLTFESARQEFSAMNLAFGEAQMKTLRVVNEDGMYNNLALLISDQCPHTIKVAVFQGTKKSVFKDRSEVHGSLFRQLHEAYRFLEQYNRTRAEFYGLRRIDLLDYPVDALREALLNSIVHRDYAFSGSTLISIFDDRIELVTIGGLVTGISYKDMMLGVSVARNENLANIFYRLKLIEAYGVGIPKIMESYSDTSVNPIFTVTDNAFKLTLPNCNIGREIESEQTDGLSDKEKQVLTLLKHAESITRKDIQKALGISQSSAITILKKLTAQELLHKNGSGKNTRYVR